MLEATGNADKVLGPVGEFGADTRRCATHHPWTAQLARNAEIGAFRGAHDMRLAVFNAPPEGRADAVVMNLLMGRAVGFNWPRGEDLQPLVGYWWSRVSARFGSEASTKAESFKAMRLRRSTNAELKAHREAEAGAVPAQARLAAGINRALRILGRSVRAAGFPSGFS